MTLRSTQVNQHNAKELGFNSSFQDKRLYFMINDTTHYRERNITELFHN